VKCPHCGNEIDPVDDQQYCHFCGGDLSQVHVPNRLTWETNRLDDEDPKLELDNGFNTERLEYCPWEDQEYLGFLTGFYLTLKESMFSANEFFGHLPKTNGFLLPLLYALIIQTLGFMFSYVWAVLTNNPILEQLAQILEKAALTGYGSILLGVAVPAFVFVGVVVWAFLLHITLAIVGGANEGFESTFRVNCYASGPELFNLVPVIGGFIAFFWKIYITVIGLREVHQTSLGKAIAAVLLPTLLCCSIFIVTPVIIAGMALPTR
jgi:hypothetical protein